MKLVLQIALGVFIGALAALYLFEEWRTYTARQTAEIEQRNVAEQKRLRELHGASIREMFLRSRQEQGAAADSDTAARSNQEQTTPPPHE